MAFLRLYTADGDLQTQWPLESRPLTLGRTSQNDIVLNDPEVSKAHARIETAGSGHILIDLDSANGVFVNGTRIKRHALKYWDEIRIYPYKLTYMARATLPGEEHGQSAQGPATSAQNHTVVISKADVAALIKLQQMPKVAYLTCTHSGARLLVKTGGFSFGRSRECDLRCGGWFAPAYAARIEQRADGYYLVPAKRGRIFVNGERRRDSVHLTDSTELKIQGTRLTYYFRTLEK